MRRFCLSLLAAFFLVALALPVLATTRMDSFPVHASMRPNVEFWKKIYSEYPSTKGVLHDSNNLNIIYEVIDLEPHGHGSSRINRKRVKKAKKRYQNMLNKFARGKAPATRDERRVYALFGPNPKRHEFRQAKEDIRSQTGQKDRFLAGVKRSGKYLDRIKDIFKSQGLPEDLAYLPHVESSYNYEAYSKFGAAGIWQFTRSTGRRYMQVDYVVDERRDPIAASFAAAKFLKENHELLGSWPLALTAYNHGPNGMLRAKKQKGSYARIFDEYAGKRFKFASRNFYSEFIAARYVAKNYRRYFGNVSVDKKVICHTVEMEGFAPVDRMCQFFRVGVDEVKKVNPALRPPVFNGQKSIPKGYRLRLPGHSQKMARMSSAIPSSLFDKSQKRSKFYRVQRGDTVGKIARRHRVTIKDFVAANGLSRRATIYVGQNLRIPGVGEKATALASVARHRRQSAAEPTMAILREKVLAKATDQESAKSPVRSLAKWRPHGNPFGLIAAREETTPPALLVARAEKKVVEPVETPVLAQDEMEEAAMTVVEAAKLSGSGDAAEVINPLVVVGNFDVTKMKTVKGAATGTIQVEVEETLGHYADWLEIPTRKIRSLNRYRFGKPIQYGQKLKLPFAKVSKEDFEERRYLYHKELVEDFFVAYKVESETIYKVKKGDNLWTLCHEDFELPFWLIKQYNVDFDFRGLRLGTKIKVPVVTKIESDSQVAEVTPVSLPGKVLAQSLSAKKLTAQ